jgi:hypothetical protein
MTTVADVKARIINEVGETTPPALAPEVDAIWDAWADKSVLYPHMQEFWTKRSLIEVARATLRNQVDFAHDGAISLKLSQRLGYLDTQYANVCTQIKHFEDVSRAGRVPVTAPLTSAQLAAPPWCSPPPPPCYNYALSPYFVGSPYWRNPGIAPVGGGGLGGPGYPWL